MAHLDELRRRKHERRGFKPVLALCAVILCVLVWQCYEHRRIRMSAQASLQNRARDITNSLGVVMRSQGRFGMIPQGRLEAALNEMAKSEEIEGITLLNQDGEPTASAGKPIDLASTELVTAGECWQAETVTFVNLVDLGMLWGDQEAGDAKQIIVVTEDHAPDRRSPGFRRGPWRRPSRESLGEEADQKLEAMMDGRPMDEASIAEFLSLIPGDGPDERRRQAIHELLIGIPLDETNAAAGLEIALMGDREGRRPRFPRDLLSEEANRLVEAMMDGGLLDEDGVAAFLSLIPEGSLDERRRQAIRSLLLGAALDESSLRTALHIAFMDTGEPRVRRPAFGRPPWLSEREYEELQRTRGAHWFVLTLSNLGYKFQVAQDFRLRGIVLLAGLIAVGSAGLAWRTLERSSQLRIRLVRATDLNLHLREMNVAATGLVHETKNPLNVVRGLAQMMAKDADAPDSLRVTAVQVTEEVDRVTDRLNKFLNYSRPQEVKLAPTNLRRLIEGVCRVLESDRDDKDVELAVIGPEFMVEADEALLRQVVFNLLLNAFQSVGHEGRIQVEMRKTGHKLASFEVCDNGSGVSEEAREDIFRPYYTTNNEGSGLGLAIVRQIVLAHQWEIACESAPTGGACLRVSGLRIL